MDATPATRDALLSLQSQPPRHPQLSSPELRRLLHRLTEDEPAPECLGNLPGTIVTKQEEGKALPATRTAIRLPSGGKPKAKTNGNGTADWLNLKQRVRSTMAERGMSYADPARELGLAKSTIENGVCKSSPPSAPVLAKLLAFVDQPAPEVATPATFHGTSNGACGSSSSSLKGCHFARFLAK